MIKSATCTAFIVALMASGAAPASAQVPGNQPIVGISLESSTPIVAKVAGVDPSGGTVTLMLAGGTTNGGAVHTFSATDAAAQAQLPRIRPGYKLTIIDLQAVIGAIEKKT
jgi:hypothetical protein